jgi:hypothetical protein
LFNFGQEPGVALASSLEGSIMCGAPTRWTNKRAR